MEGLLDDLKAMIRPVIEARILSMEQIIVSGFGS